MGLWRRIRIAFFLGLVIFSLGPATVAGYSDTAEDPVGSQNLRSQLQWDQDLSEILNRGEFSEMDDLRTLFWNALWTKLLEFLRRNLIWLKATPALEAMTGIVKAVMWGLVLMVFVFLLLALFRQVGRQKAVDDVSHTPLVHEDRHQQRTGLERELGEAVKRGNWLAALRTRYLLSLEILRANQVISDPRRSTLGMIKRHLLRRRPTSPRSIASVTALMNHSLYGVRPVNEPDFRSLDRELGQIEAGL